MQQKRENTAVKKRRTATSKKQDIGEQVDLTFWGAAPDAAKLCVDMLRDDSIPDKTRLDIARTILARIYQKEQEMQADDNKISFVLEAELQKYAK